MTLRELWWAAEGAWSPTAALLSAVASFGGDSRPVNEYNPFAPRMRQKPVVSMSELRKFFEGNKSV